MFSNLSLAREKGRGMYAQSQSTALNEVVFRYFDDPIGSEGLVEFRLLYSGQLLASGNNARHPREKHLIRKQFHPQLRQLWQTNPNLRDWALARGGMSLSSPGDKDRESVCFQNGVTEMAEAYRFNQFRFLPLVTAED